MNVRIGTAKIGDHRGKPRIYIQGKYLLSAGFFPSSNIYLLVEKNKIVIRPTSSKTTYKVSSKKSGTIPVIDLNNEGLKQAFNEASEVQIVTKSGIITITQTRVQSKKNSRCRNRKSGSLFSGGGLLDQAAKNNDYVPSFAVEIDQNYLNAFEENHPTAKLFNMGIHEVILSELPEVELLTMGIPCEPYSQARTLVKSKKRDRSLPPEAHDLGDMVFWSLRIIDHLNPASIVIEEAPNFLKSGAGFILLRALERVGYYVWSDVIDSLDYGQLTSRKRGVIIATSDEFYVPPSTSRFKGKLSSIFDSDISDDCWFDRKTKGWLFNHWDRHNIKGNGFAAKRLTGESRHAGTIKKRYFAIQGDNPVISHPEKEETFRLFSINEVKKLMGLDDDYVLPKSKTIAGEILGQGVSVGLFTQLIGSID